MCIVMTTSATRSARRVTRAVLAVLPLLLVLVLLCSQTHVAAQAGAGPITPEQCKQVNPFWNDDTCESLYGTPAVNYYAQLPWNDVPGYAACVRQRCVCTQLRNDTNFVPNGLYCSSDVNAFTESGFVTCNVMVDCYATFWRCVTDALVDRMQRGGNVTDSEAAIWGQIVVHGNTRGQPFEDTDLYDSCRFLTCQAASSRQSCGLRTCLPNSTQCYEYMRPPPLPYRHQLCTQGCRAGLVLMALTIATVCFALCCCGCCPPRVRAVDPLFNKNGSNGSSGAASHKPQPISP